MSPAECAGTGSTSDRRPPQRKGSHTLTTTADGLAAIRDAITDWAFIRLDATGEPGRVVVPILETLDAMIDRWSVDGEHTPDDHYRLGLVLGSLGYMASCLVTPDGELCGDRPPVPGGQPDRRGRFGGGARCRPGVHAADGRVGVGLAGHRRPGCSTPAAVGRSGRWTAVEDQWTSVGLVAGHPPAFSLEVHVDEPLGRTRLRIGRQPRRQHRQQVEAQVARIGSPGDEDSSRCPGLPELCCATRSSSRNAVSPT